MPDVKISALPTKTIASDDMVVVVNASATTTSRVTAGAIAGLVVDASQLTSGTLPDARLSANVVVTSDSRLSNARTPTAHTHGISEVTGLQTALDGKQASGSYSVTGHTHAISDVAGLQTALDGKQASGSYSVTGHTHAISDVAGLQTALDGKQASGSYSTVGHTHGLTDLAQSSASTNQVVTWNGTSWVPATVSYNNITDKPASSGLSIGTIWALS